MQSGVFEPECDFNNWGKQQNEKEEKLEQKQSFQIKFN